MPPGSVSTPLGCVQVRREAEAALQEQRGNEARERAALRTILDTKMRNLLADLGRGLSELPPGVSTCCRAPHSTARQEQACRLHDEPRFHEA